jgi:hypothetical protein
MFGRKKIIRLQRHEYLDRFMALRRKWPDGYPDHATSLQEALVIAVGILHAIFDRNGGSGWSEDADREHLDLIREHLLSFNGFTSAEKASVEWALAEILECGRELERDGESAREATGGLEVLKSRVVDWILAHPDEIPIRKDDDYRGHD